MQAKRLDHTTAAPTDSTPRHSRLMDAVGVPQGMEPIPVPSDADGLAIIARTDSFARDMVTNGGREVAAEADAGARLTAVQAAILKKSTFFDGAILRNVRGRHERKTEAVQAGIGRQFEDAFHTYSDANAIVCRILMDRRTPEVIDAAGEANRQHEPGYDAMRAGVIAAQGRLARAATEIPARPTLPERDQIPPEAPRDARSRGSG